MNGQRSQLWTSDYCRILLAHLLLLLTGNLLASSFSLYLFFRGGTDMTIGVLHYLNAFGALLMRPFAGWYLGDALYDFNTPVTAPLTLTARWKEVPSSGGYYYYPTTDTKTDDTKGSPKTADPGVALYGVLSLLSLTGLTCATKKR